MGLGSGLRRYWHHSSFPKEASETPCTFVGLEDIRWPGWNKERGEVSMKLGMDGPGYREAKAALSVPLQKFPGASTNPSSKCCARAGCRDALGVSVFYCPGKIMWPGKVTPRQAGRFWHTPVCRPGSPHPWARLFPAGCAAAGADRDNLEGSQSPVPPGTDWQLTWQLHANTHGKQHFWLCSWSRRWIQLSYLMFSSCEQVLGQADICSHSALLLRYEGMALQALLRELAGFKSQNQNMGWKKLFSIKPHL